MRLPGPGKESCDQGCDVHSTGGAAEGGGARTPDGCLRGSDGARDGGLRGAPYMGAEDAHVPLILKS